jgi:hypothetical protein
MFERKEEAMSFEALELERTRFLGVLEEVDSKVISLLKTQCTPYDGQFSGEQLAKLKSLDVLIEEKLAEHQAELERRTTQQKSSPS